MNVINLIKNVLLQIWNILLLCILCNKKYYKSCQEKNLFKSTIFFFIRVQVKPTPNIEKGTLLLMYLWCTLTVCVICFAGSISLFRTVNVCHGICSLCRFYFKLKSHGWMYWNLNFIFFRPRYQTKYHWYNSCNWLNWIECFLMTVVQPLTGYFRNISKVSTIYIIGRGLQLRFYTKSV